MLVSHKNRIFASQKDNDIMNIKNIHLVYYSATFSTRRVVREIASQFQKKAFAESKLPEFFYVKS